jgi:hypothetical protein
MRFLHARSAYARSALLASAVVAFGAGCTARYSGTVGGPAYVESTPGGAPPVVVAAGGPADVDADVVYEPQPPVDDIEEYPAVVYGGVTVYYIGGRWYRHGDRGWGYYRNEPPELVHQREMHDRDPRWVHAREAPARPELARPGVAERQAPGRETPIPPRADEARAPARIAPPATAAAAHAQPTDKTGPAATKRKAAAKKTPPARAGSVKEPERR